MIRSRVLLAASMLAVSVSPMSCAPAVVETASPVSGIGDEYLERYFAAFPTRATAAGRHDHDAELDDLGAEAREAWVVYNEAVIERLEALDPSELSFDDQVDTETLLGQARGVVHSARVLARPERYPLYWTGRMSGATLHLLLRDDIPERDRLEAAAARVAQIPRLAAQAREALEGTDPALIAPVHAGMGARQVRAAASFYRSNFHDIAEAQPEDLATRMREAANLAAPALDDLADFFDALAARATGSPRLDEAYADRFRIVNGIDTPIDEVLAEAERALGAKRVEAAAFGREVWSEVVPGAQPPEGDADLLRRLFDRIAVDRASSRDELVADYEALLADSVAFVRERGLVTLPDPLTIYVGRSPAFLSGQSVGGVYPAGPYSPEAETLFMLPMPADDATTEQADAFYRDFNHHFNVMILPHEIVPGHYLHLKNAARHPNKLRAMFPDAVATEGWGTFCERLMLDEGWGDSLDRLAHLKKQLENIARTIVDIRVHTDGIERDEVIRFVLEDALQDEQFAGNMWGRTLTSAPQLTSYWLGYREVMGLYEDVRAARGDDFVLREFMDGMMEIGPVAVKFYRQRMLGE